jgi:hypothetical protein
MNFSLLLYSVKLIACTVAGENVRASREKSGNHRLANLATCYYKYVYVILCIQSCPILRGINILSITFGDPYIRVSFFPDFSRDARTFSPATEQKHVKYSMRKSTPFLSSGSGLLYKNFQRISVLNF